MNGNLVSVVIPTGNGTCCSARMIDSVLGRPSRSVAAMTGDVGWTYNTPELHLARVRLRGMNGRGGAS